MQNRNASRPKANPQTGNPHPDKRLAVAYALNAVIRRSYETAKGNR